MSEEDEQQRQSAIREQNLENKQLIKQAKLDKKLEKKRLKKEKRKERLERMVGFLPSDLLRKPEQGNRMDSPDVSRTEEAFRNGVDEMAEKAPGNGHDIAQEACGNGFGMAQEEAFGSDLDAIRQEKERLLAEAEAAKIQAQAAQARLEAAQAKLVAQEAQAKLAEVEAKLQLQTRVETKLRVEAQHINQGNPVSGNGSNKKRRKKR